MLIIYKHTSGIALNNSAENRFQAVLACCDAQQDSAVCPCCFQLTGHGSIYNISNGVVAKDSTAFSNATTLVTTYTTI